MKLTFVFCILLASSSIAQNVENQAKYSLKIDFGDSMKNGTVVIKTRFFFDSALEKNDIKILDSTKINNGRYLYTYNDSHYPLSMVEIYFYDVNNKKYGIYANLPKINMTNGTILLEKRNFSLKAKKIKGNNICAEVSGAVDNAASIFYNFDNFSSYAFTDEQGLVKDSTFVRKYNNSEYLAYKIMSDKSLYPYETLQLFYNIFNDSVKKSVYGEEMFSYINNEKAIKKDGIKAFFHLYDSTYKKYNFDDFIGDKKLGIIIFWASWCGPCRGEMPIYKKMYEDFRKQVSFVNVTIDEKYDKWIKALEKEKMPWLNLSGFESKNSSQNPFNIDFVPQIYIVDYKGNILYGKNKFVDITEINEFIDDYLKK